MDPHRPRTGLIENLVLMGVSHRPRVAVMVTVDLIFYSDMTSNISDRSFSTHPDVLAECPSSLTFIFARQ